MPWSTKSLPVRRLLLLGLGALAAPASAQAAPFGELPFRSVPTAAVCVRATGVPGELIRWSRGGLTVMQARPDGLRDVTAVPLGTLSDCPAVAADPATGATVVAGTTKRELLVTVRAPGGGWSAPVRIADAGYEIKAAVSPRGDALVAWEAYAKRGTQVQIRAARHAAGTDAWVTERLSDLVKTGFGTAVEAGMTAAGESVVVYGEDVEGESGKARIRVTTAPPAGRFARARTLATTKWGSTPALAVAPDGRALVAVGGFNDLSIYERPPGGAFAPPVSVFSGAMQDRPNVALRPDGAAVIAWRQGTDDPLFAVMRSGPGPFGPLRRAEQKLVQRRSGSAGSRAVVPGAVPYEGAGVDQVTLGPDGRALVVYPTSESGLGVVSLAPDGTAEQGLLGSPLRDPVGLTPLVLADGTRAVAWSDNKGLTLAGPHFPRLHYAVEGAAAAPEPAAPEVTAGPPNRRALRPAQTLRLPIHCNAACDVRVQFPGNSAGDDDLNSLGRAGTFVVTLRPGSQPLAPANGHPLKLTVHYGAPGARAPKVKVVSLKLRRLPARPVPRVLNLRARRAGNSVIVTWDTSVPARDVLFSLFGSPTRAEPKRYDAFAGTGGVVGHGQRHFRVRLKHARRARYVTFEMAQYVGRSRQTRTIQVG